MKVTSTVSVFHVKDVKASLSYYRDILGFTEEFTHEGYVGLKMGEAGLHLSSILPSHAETGSGTAYFFCDEVDSYYTEIKGKGAKVKSAPEDQPYGLRDFIVADLDGNHLSFGCFLSRP